MTQERADIISEATAILEFLPCYSIGASEMRRLLWEENLKRGRMMWPLEKVSVCLEEGYP